jgi:FMN phosphatase YigB (HAD superfamily)
MHIIEESYIDIYNSIKMLKEKGYKLVIATNPLLPLQANLKRISWAGLNYKDFSHITCFEKSTFCKPRIEFYQEVLKTINKKPSECLMVGNDVLEDLVIQKLGVETYLITDCIINKHNQPFESNYTGNYNEFFSFVQTLPNKKQKKHN